MSPHPLTNFKIQKYYQNEYKLHVLHTNDNNLTCFYSFKVEHIPREIKEFLGNKKL